MMLKWTTPSITAPERPNYWDALALALVLGLAALVAHAGGAMDVPFTLGKDLKLSLDPGNLPEYALRSTLRMAIAMLCALVFSMIYATIAAHSRMAEKILIPLLDVLQSVPILGFLSITVTGFIALFPGSLLGVECASIFAIFTSQAWNIAFSLYQSFRTVPRDLVDASTVFRASPWRRFWRLDVPFAMPQLVWNLMMSASGGWFFVVASEAITVAGHRVMLPGIGSYIALAIEAKNLRAVVYALIAMFVIIVAIDQLVFRPLLVWSDKFRPSDAPDETEREAWFLNMVRGARFLAWLADTARAAGLAIAFRHRPADRASRRPVLSFKLSETAVKGIERAWNAAILLATLAVAKHLYDFVVTAVPLREIGRVALYGLYTGTRVFLLIAIASAIWVPVGVAIGLRPRLAQRIQPVVQILAAFPANLMFPLAVILIARWQANPEIWLSPLMILGTQWYILFNVIGGISTLPAELRFAAENFGVRGWLWWRRVVVPYLLPAYVTGVVTASGGAWNASIVAEIVKWGETSYSATGIGAYIARATEAGDMKRVMLGIGVLCVYVTILNRFLWRRLYAYAEERVRLG